MGTTAVSAGQSLPSEKLYHLDAVRAGVTLRYNSGVIDGCVTNLIDQTPDG